MTATEKAKKLLEVYNSLKKLRKGAPLDKQESGKLFEDLLRTVSLFESGMLKPHSQTEVKSKLTRMRNLSEKLQFELEAKEFGTSLMPYLDTGRETSFVSNLKSSLQRLDNYIVLSLQSRKPKVRLETNERDWLLEQLAELYTQITGRKAGRYKDSHKESDNARSPLTEFFDAVLTIYAPRLRLKASGYDSRLKRTKPK